MYDHNECIAKILAEKIEHPEVKQLFYELTIPKNIPKHIQDHIIEDTKKFLEEDVRKRYKGDVSVYVGVKY